MVDNSEFINGMIFVCDETTVNEMFQNQIFGLPPTYLREMKQLVPDKSALFLLEKNTNVMRGIFTPTSTAKKHIVADIWQHSHNSDVCAFPSQIRFRMHSSYRALPKDSEYAPLFLRRMKVKGKFLDRMRVRSLISALTNYHAALQREQAELTALFRSCVVEREYSRCYRNPYDPLATVSYLQREVEDLRAENMMLMEDKLYSEYKHAPPPGFTREKLPYNVNAIAHFKNQTPPDIHNEIQELFEEENLEKQCHWALQSAARGGKSALESQI